MELPISEDERKITKLCSLSLVIYLETDQSIRKRLMDIWGMMNGTPAS
jgi:hypothetical protein